MNTETTVREITEADVVAFLAKKTAEFRAEFPQVHELRATADHNSVGIFGYADTSYSGHISGYGENYAEVAKRIREQIGTPESVAAKKREAAARLLAEADKLAPAAA